jgi:hypothetical protein
MRPPCPPFSPCWCELNPTNPRCVETLSITSDVLSIVLIITITFLTFKVLKKIKTNRKLCQSQKQEVL